MFQIISYVLKFCLLEGMIHTSTALIVALMSFQTNVVSN
jgi:hypothetical protein